ncbi:MAG TPA: hypothetical protein VFN97_00930 [Actinospica sp.]|nr:hypothetical protein [Actinospica sp.]
MRHIELNATVDNISGVISAEAYLEQLPRLTPSMPTGARTFATDPMHYEFLGRRCIKDLTVNDLAVRGDDGRIDLELTLGHNCWKHDDNLFITYTGVSSFELRSADGTGRWTSLHSVILDEILPHERGCSHEIACHGGTLTLVARDFSTAWIPAHCTNQRGQL